MEKVINKLLNEFIKEEFVNILCRFYVEVCFYDGKYYSCNLMRVIWVGLDRYLNKENINFSIIIDREFKFVNDVFNVYLVEFVCEGNILFMKYKLVLIF